MSDSLGWGIFWIGSAVSSACLSYCYGGYAWLMIPAELGLGAKYLLDFMEGK